MPSTNSTRGMRTSTSKVENTALNFICPGKRWNLCPLMHRTCQLVCKEQCVLQYQSTYYNRAFQLTFRPLPWIFVVTIWLVMFEVLWCCSNQATGSSKNWFQLWPKIVTCPLRPPQSMDFISKDLAFAPLHALRIWAISLCLVKSELDYCLVQIYYCSYMCLSST